jgi:hypothetical protein
MASGRKGQSDITLGAGHVAAVFLGVLVLCGLFFTLGYVVGRGHGTFKPGLPGQSQPTTVVGADGNLTTNSGGPPPSGWDFFPRNASSSQGMTDTPVPGLTPSSRARTKPVAESFPPPSGPIAMNPHPRGLRIDSQPPVLANGQPGIALQVAALNNRADAIALAGFLKKKGYPAFAWGPARDRLYKVQVGPYASAKAAEAMKLKLEREGFKSILKK